MYKLIIHPEVDAELDALYDIDEDAAALIDALLEELECNPSFLAGLFRPGNHYKHDPPFEVKDYEAMKHRGMFILIFKVKHPDGSLLPFRVLVGYDAWQENFHVLGASHREESYDSKQFTADVVRRYSESGLHTHPRRY